MFFSGFAGFFVSKKRVEKELDKLEPIVAIVNATAGITITLGSTPESSAEIK